MTNIALSKLMETIPLPVTSWKKKKNKSDIYSHFLFMCVVSCLLFSVFQAAGATNCSQAPLPRDLTWLLIPTSGAFNLTAGFREALLHTSNKVIRKRVSPIPSSLPELMVNHMASPWCLLHAIYRPSLGSVWSESFHRHWSQLPIFKSEMLKESLC